MGKEFLNKDEFNELSKYGIDLSKYKYYFCWDDDINNGIIVHESMKDKFKNSYQTLSFFDLINLIPNEIESYYFQIDFEGKWLGYEYLNLIDTTTIEYLHTESFKYTNEPIHALYNLVIWYAKNYGVK